MGYQQLLVIIVGIIAVSMAIGVGISVFTSHSIQANKMGITNDLLVLGRYAYGYRLRTVPQGGGGSQYAGFLIPSHLQVNANATYSAESMPSFVIFSAVSKLGYGTISAVLDSSGTLSSFSYSGDFR